MKNQARWDFAQKFSSLRMIQLELLMIVISFFKMFLKTDYEMFIGMLVLFSAVLFLFFSTEKAIRKNFPENVN